VSNFLPSELAGQLLDYGAVGQCCIDLRCSAAGVVHDFLQSVRPTPDMVEWVPNAWRSMDDLPERLGCKKTVSLSVTVGHALRVAPTKESTLQMYEPENWKEPIERFLSLMCQ